MAAKFVYTLKDSQGNPVPISGINGFQITWNMKESEFIQQMVIDAHSRNYLPVDHLQKGQKRIVATKRALQKLKGSGMLKEIETNDHFMRFQICEEFIDNLPSGSTFKNLRVKEIIRYNSDTDGFDFEDKDGNHFTNDFKAKEIMDMVSHCNSVFTKMDMTRYIQRLFQGKGMISLLDRGGAYFVPAIHHDLVFNIKRMMKEIDPEGNFNYTEIPNAPGANESVSVSFVSEVKATMTLLKKKNEERKANGDKMSRTIYSGLMDEIAELTGNLELYIDMTGYEMRDAKELMEETSKEITDFMMNGLAAKP